MKNIKDKIQDETLLVPLQGLGVKILVFDNYDSFTYNLVHAVKKLGYTDVEVHHGVSSMVDILEEDILFNGLSKQQEVGRYHSWAAEKSTLPECLTITAVDEEGMIMALHHKEYDVRGVQFHPESVLTPDGEKMLKNWLEA